MVTLIVLSVAYFVVFPFLMARFHKKADIYDSICALLIFIALHGIPVVGCGLALFWICHKE